MNTLCDSSWLFGFSFTSVSGKSCDHVIIGTAGTVAMDWRKLYTPRR